MTYTPEQAAELARAHYWRPSNETMPPTGKTIKIYPEELAAMLNAAHKPQSEPVAWMGVHDQTDLYHKKPQQGDVIPLYTAPPDHHVEQQRDLLRQAREALQNNNLSGYYNYADLIAVITKALEEKS